MEVYFTRVTLADPPTLLPKEKKFCERDFRGWRHGIAMVSELLLSSWKKYHEMRTSKNIRHSL